MTIVHPATHPDAGGALRADETLRGPSDAFTPRSFRVARVPDGAGTQHQRLWTLALVQLTVVLLILPVDATWPVWLRVALAAGLVVATVAVPWQYFRVVRLRRNAPATLLLDGDALRILGSKGEPVFALDYERILSLEPQGRGRTRALIVLFTGGGPLDLRERLFASPEEAQQASEALSARIALLPDARRRGIETRGEVARLALRRIPTVSLGFTALACGAFAARSLLADGAQPQLESEVASSGADLLQGGVLRLLTPFFVHAGALHLAGNAGGLLLLGGMLEPVLGRARWLALIGLSSIAGFLTSSLWEPSRYSIGASGGAMGALAALVVLNVIRRSELSARLRLPGATLACLAVLLVAAERWPLNLDHAAHLGGFLVGGAICALSVRGVPLARVAERTPRTLAALGWLLAAAYALAFANVLYAVARLA